MTVPKGFKSLEIVIPDHVSPEKRPLLLETSKLLEDKIYYWPGPTYPQPLPPSKFPPSTPTLINLFQTQDEKQELEALSVDAKGQPRSLTETQLDQIAEHGQFDVASKQYPCHSHTWKVAGWLQKGRVPTQKSFERGLGRSLYHLIIGVPDRLIRNKFISVRRGLSHIRSGMRSVVSLLVGLKEMVPKHTHSEVQRLIQAQENDCVKQQLETEESSFDTRIFDNNFIARHKLTIDLDHGNQLRGSGSEKEHIQAMKDIEALGVVDPVERTYRLERLLKRRHLEKIRQRLESDASLPPGFGKLVADRELLNCIVTEVEDDMRRAVDEQRKTIKERLIAENPILSTMPDWLSDKVSKEVDQWNHDQEVKWDWYRKVAVVAAKEGLSPLAAVYRDKILPFRMNLEPALRQQLSSEVKPARNFEIYRRIWRPKNWIRVERREPNGNVSFEAQKHYVESVTTDYRFWRVALILRQSRANFCNGLFCLFRSLWNGPLGLKSLFLQDPFIFCLEMDPLSGEIVADTKHKTQTLLSRLRGIRNHVRKIRDDFEALPDTGFLGKSLSRVLNILSAHLGVGIPGAIIVALGQPILTVLQGICTMALVITSPIWAFLGSLVEHIFSITIYDFHDPYDFYGSPLIMGRWFPLVGCIVEVAFSGVVRLLLALMGLVFHPTMAVVHFVWEVLRRQLRMGYDWIIRHLLLHFGRVPAQDSFLAWRIAGPGITAKYCYQIRPEVAILVLEALLEEKELDLYKKSVSNKIKEPLDKYKAFFKDFLVFGLEVGNSQQGGRVSELKQVVAKQLKSLETMVSQRRQVTRGLTGFENRNGPRASGQAQRILRMESEVCDIQLGESLGWIKQSEQDLEKTSRLGEEVVASFFQRVEKLYPEHIMTLWCDVSLVPGDYSGLLRYLLAQIFGNGFWMPLEESDETIVIPVKHQTLEKLVYGLMQPTLECIT